MNTCLVNLCESHQPPRATYENERLYARPLRTASAGWTFALRAVAEIDLGGRRM